MQIRVVQPFKHGRDAFHAGDVRTVSDADGAYFKANGWATDPGEDAPTPTSQEPVNLEVQSLLHKQGVQNG